MAYRRIGIIGAMEEEIELLRQHLEESQTIVKAGITYREGVFHGQSVVVCKSGVGKVNAAVCSQILIDAFGVDAVIFTGVAGALDPSLNIGDIVISTECMQHDMDVTALGFPRGTIPFTDSSVFVADPALFREASLASERLTGKRAHQGRILSGDQFIASREKVAELHREMEGSCTEMEGAAVAQVCDMNQVPFVIIRSMSDKADGSADVNFTEFTKTASENSYRLLEDLIKNLKDSQ